jgi:hypothetical protein
MRRLLICCNAHYVFPKLRKFAPREKLLQKCGHCSKVFLTLEVKEHFCCCPVLKKLNAQLLLPMDIPPPGPFQPFKPLINESELENAG